MKKVKLINSIFALAFALLLSTSVFAQDKPMKKHPAECKCESCATMSQAVEHQCTDECKEHGCDFVKAKEMKAANSKAVKHVCTDECKTKGCDFVKANEARAALDLNHDGSIYECPMKCEASDHEGECSKCGMELKKVSVKS
jgi:hypothetical protein